MHRQHFTVAPLPEAAPQRSKSWVVLMGVGWVSSQDKQVLVGAEQVKALLDDERLPSHGQWVAEEGDSRYSQPAYLHAVRQTHPELDSVVRLRGDRMLRFHPQLG